MKVEGRPLSRSTTDIEMLKYLHGMQRHAGRADGPLSARNPGSSTSGMARLRKRHNEEVGWKNASPGNVSGNIARSYEERNPLTLPPLQREMTDMGNLCIVSRRPKSPAPNYTMINKRAVKSPTTPDFKALNSSTKPIPSLLDKPHEEKAFPKKSIRMWKDEVKKVVPSRPAIAIKSDWQAPPAEWDDRDQYIYGAKPIFYKNTKYVIHRDFVVNPEWLSEFMTVSTYSPAYRTCALRYGWCA